MRPSHSENGIGVKSELEVLAGSTGITTASLTFSLLLAITRNPSAYTLTSSVASVLQSLSRKKKLQFAAIAPAASTSADSASASAAVDSRIQR